MVWPIIALWILSRVRYGRSESPVSHESPLPALMTRSKSTDPTRVAILDVIVIAPAEHIVRTNRTLFPLGLKVGLCIIGNVTLIRVKNKCRQRF